MQHKNKPFRSKVGRLKVEGRKDLGILGFPGFLDLPASLECQEYLESQTGLLRYEHSLLRYAP